MMDAIYQALIADSYIAEQAAGRIKYYQYPATGDVTGPYIIIDPLDVPTPDDFADDTWLTDDYLYQVEVWSKNRKTTEALADRVRKILWTLGFKQGSGMQEYDEGIFRDARRYRGKFYRGDFDSL